MCIHHMKRQTLRYACLQNMELVPKEIERNSVLCYLVVFQYEKQIKDICNAIHCILFFDEVRKMSAGEQVTGTLSFVDIHLVGHYEPFVTLF